MNFIKFAGRHFNLSVLTPTYMYKGKLHKSVAFKLVQVLVFSALFAVQLQAKFIRLSSRNILEEQQFTTSKVSNLKSFQEKSTRQVQKHKLNKRYQNSDVLAVLPVSVTPFYFVFFSRHSAATPSFYLPVYTGNGYLLRGPPATV